LAREALTDVARLKRCIAVLCVAAVVQALVPFVVLAAHRWRSHSAAAPQIAQRSLPYPRLELPFEISGSQYFPVAWSDVPGWADDDQLAAYKTFRASCRSIVAQHDAPPDGRALGASLQEPCRAARATEITDSDKARAFFEDQFVPLEISRLGQDAGFVTGYYEPVIDGSLTQTDVYNVPVYRRPSNLFMHGYTQASPELPNKGGVFRRIGRRKFVPYYDRGQIEDGILAGRGIELCWLKDPTDLLFAQIEGSARIHLPDGSMLRINYDSYNGYPFTPVGRVLVERGIFSKEEISMQKIRDWMEANPDGAKELRRQNRSYVFFRVVQLPEKEEAIGAQGIPLTPGRSIAVDKSLHVYGTPFFIAGELPIESERSKTPFHRLMIAQDTGSAIVGPARADLYFGSGHEAGKVAGRLKSNMRFVMLVPKSLDPAARGKMLPLPDARPSEQIAKLFPQTAPAKNLQSKDQQTKDQPQVVTKDQKAASPVPSPTPSATIGQTATATTATSVPLPAERPKTAPVAAPAPAPELHHHRARRARYP
jgi:membrane-bound lytic murein transglycosylase A